MKMRKKLAAVLAAAMIASVMPMTAFAASTNRVTKTVKVAEDAHISESSAPNLVIDLKDTLTSGDAFYLELENAEWKENDKAGVVNPFTWGNQAGPRVTLRRVGKTTLEVKANQPITSDEAVLSIPMIVKATGGEATVAIDSYGSVVSGGKYVFAVSDDSKAKAKVGDLTTIVDKGKMATITIEEPYAGAFAAKEAGKDKVITIELDDENFEFVSKGSTEIKRGFTGTIANTISKDGSKLTVTIPKASVIDKQRGVIEIKDVEILATRKAVEGDVSVYISGEVLENETLVVAKYGDYTTTLTTKEVKDYTAGNKETLKFKLSEVGAGAIVKQRSADFILSEDIKVTEVKVNGKILTNSIDADDKNEFVITSFDKTTDAAIELNSDNELEFELEVEIPAKFTGDITVKAEGRAIGEVKELKLAEVKAPVTVEVEAMKIDAGQKSNMGGKITLTETEKGMIQRGTLVIQLPKDLKDDGVEFVNVDDIVLDTTGGIRVDDAKYNKDKSAIEIKVTRQSSEAGSIEISGFEVKASRLIADGAYEIEIGGDALSKEVASLLDGTKRNEADTADVTDVTKYANIDAIAEVDFILVGDQATKEPVSFVIGSNKFLLGGKEMTMDAAAYIKDGRTMVPLRYLSTALGIDEEAIKFNAGIVTIFAADGRIIQVKNGDKTLEINGMKIPMTAAAEIVEGRTYVPVTEIGAVFGVAGTWDAAAQTATFQ